MAGAIFFRLALLGLVAAATWLRWCGTTYGLPEITHPDEPYIVETAVRMASGDGLHPETFFYPSLQFYTDALAYRVVVWFGQLFGWIDALSELELPTLYRIARSVTVLFAAGTIFLTYLAARRLTDDASALVAAALVSVSLLHVANSFLATVDVPMGFWTLLTALAALRILRSPSFGAYAVAAVCAGCAAGTKYNGVFAVLPIIVAHLAGHWRGLRSLVDPRLIGAGGISAIAFFLTTPYALIDYDLFDQFIKFQRQSYGSGHPGTETFSSSYGIYARSIYEKFGAVSTAICLLGWVVLLWRRTKPALVLTVFPLALFGFMGSFPTAFDRNIVSLIGFLAIGSAGLVSATASLIRRRVDEEASGHLVGMRVVPLLLLLGLIGYGAWAQADRSMSYVRLVTLPNTQVLARQWIEKNIPEGTKIGREHYTPAIDPARFAVDKLGFFGIIRTPNLVQYDYLIASSGDFARYVNHPNRYPHEARAYNNIFETWELIKTFRQNWKTTTGHQIRVYKRPKNRPGVAEEPAVLRAAGVTGKKLAKQEWRLGVTSEVTQRSMIAAFACRSREACGERGHCTAVMNSKRRGEFRCRARRLEHCTESEACKRDGQCFLLEGKCRRAPG